MSDLIKGWQCPKCARVWSPLIKACDACNNRQTLSYVPLRPAGQWAAEDESFDGL